MVKEAGCAIIGQTADLAPADRRLYAIRDVTATVESVALITASILSKKLAAGLQGLVMDVKTGSGAFMPTLNGARELAESIAAVATDAGLPTISLITDMNEPLASAAGNAVEVRNAVDYLTGARRDPRLDRVTMALGAELLALSGLAPDALAGEAALKRALESGAAAERFERMVAGLGGPKDFVSRAHDLLPRAPVLVDAMPEGRGFVEEIDVRAVGLAVVELGGGRARAADAIDAAVGLTELAPIGAEVGPDRPLARVHARDVARAEAAANRLRGAYRLGAAPLTPDDPVIDASPGRHEPPSAAAPSTTPDGVVPLPHFMGEDARAALSSPAKPGRGTMRSMVVGGPALPMNILLAVSGWDLAPWRRRLEMLVPEHKIATLGEPFDRPSVRYALPAPSAGRAR